MGGKSLGKFSSGGFSSLSDIGSKVSTESGQDGRRCSSLSCLGNNLNPSMNEWVNQTWYIHAMERLSASIFPRLHKAGVNALADALKSSGALTRPTREAPAKSLLGHAPKSFSSF